MAIADELENLPNHSPGRNTPVGWRVIDNPIRQANSESDELKTLIQTMQQRHQPTQGNRKLQGKRKLEETDPPEAA